MGPSSEADEADAVDEGDGETWGVKQMKQMGEIKL